MRSLIKPTIWELDHAEHDGPVRRAIRLFGPHVLIPRVASRLRMRWVDRGVTELPW